MGKSASYKQVCALLTKAAGSKVSILLQGETGVGKEALLEEFMKIAKEKSNLLLQ